MLKQQFKVIVTQDNSGYFVASVPALPGCHTQAKNLEQLKIRIREAVSLCLEAAKGNPSYRRRVDRLSFEPSFVGLDTVEI